LEGIVEWNERARAAVRRKLMDSQPEEEKASHACRVLERDIQSSLRTIESIDAGQSPYSRPLFVSSIAGKIERLAAHGESELVAKALQLVRDYNASHKKPAISDRHKFWELGGAAEAKAAKAEAAANAEPETIAEREGVKVIADAAADRVRTVFAAKPDVQMIGKLKAEAWKWAPGAGAWQRKLTAAAKESAKRITRFNP
jgi:hypothetical protein